jgi:hypothetical protein
MVLWREHMIMRRPYTRTTTRRAHRLKIREAPRRQPGRLKNKLRQGKLRLHALLSKPLDTKPDHM